MIKNVYFAQISKLVEQPMYFETEGPVLIQEIPENIKENKKYSFMMKDEVLPKSMLQIKKRNIPSL